MTITVATLAFGDIPYFQYSKQINREYCRVHAYRYEVIRPPSQIERSPFWYKVEGVKTLLRDAACVLFMDADAFFVDFHKTIEELVSTQMGSASVLLGTDRRDKNFAWSDENANTGVFLVRNSPTAFEILSDWWRVPIDLNRRWLWGWPPEQGAFNEYIRAGRHSQDIRIVPYYHVNGLDGTYIRHLVGQSDEMRLLTLRQEAARRDLVTAVVR
jgi:hypothetical protein